MKIRGTTTVDGVVDLQGRDDDSGAVVDPAAGAVYGWDAVAYTTGAWGAYTFANMTDDTYVISIEMPRYLDASASVSVSGDNQSLSTVILFGGDANDDDIIDVSDATIIGGEFGHTPPVDARSDINNDGTVDILDLVLMGGNYSLSTSPWSP